jgi:uncharacterized membrane protein
MSYLIAGLIVFLAVHSVRIVADGWRTRTIARVGEGTWKGLYSVVSIAGFALLVWGYGQARSGSPVLYDPPLFTRHVTGFLMLVALVLVVAAYVPANHIKAAVGHPMLAGVKAWALAHLLSNGRLADVVLFGAFLAWAVLDFVVARRRDRVAGTVYLAGRAMRTVLVLTAGAAAWAVLSLGLHRWLIGVPTH